MTIEIRLGDWRECLSDVERVDCVITDPPYSRRTHDAYRMTMEKIDGRGRIGYDHISDGYCGEFVAAWASRCAGWMCVFCSHDLISGWQRAMDAAGGCSFAPLACVIPGSTVRFTGDGPANWSTYLVVSRPRGGQYRRWGSLRGAYICSRERDPAAKIIGRKPMEMMRQIVADYSRPGDTVCDPHAGSGTTLIAAHQLGRGSIGCEVDKDTHAMASRRIEIHTAQTSIGVTK